MPPEFDPVVYVETAESLLQSITGERGIISFARPNNWGEDVHRSVLIELFSEHEGAEMAALDFLKREHPTLGFKEVGVVSRLVGHVSRAIALLEAEGGAQPRFATLSIEEQGAVIGAVLAGKRREPYSMIPPGV